MFKVTATEHGTGIQEEWRQQTARQLEDLIGSDKMKQVCRHTARCERDGAIDGGFCWSDDVRHYYVEEEAAR